MRRRSCPLARFGRDVTGDRTGGHGCRNEGDVVSDADTSIVSAVAVKRGTHTLTSFSEEGNRYYSASEGKRLEK